MMSVLPEDVRWFYDHYYTTPTTWKREGTAIPYLVMPYHFRKWRHVLPLQDADERLGRLEAHGKNFRRVL